MHHRYRICLRRSENRTADETNRRKIEVRDTLPVTAMKDEPAKKENLITEQAKTTSLKLPPLAGI